MLHAHSVEQVRAAEAAKMAQVPDGALMQRAARGLATEIARDLVLVRGRVYGGRLALLVGSGDNGGDALYAGAELARRGVRVDAYLVGSSVHRAGLARFRSAGGRVQTEPRADYAVVVDGIVGIGGRPGLRDNVLRLFHLVAQAQHLDERPRVVAVDTPSGVEVDTGRIDGAHVTADVTITFGTHKICHLVDPASLACGEVRLVDLELDLSEHPPAVEVLEERDVRALLPRPDAQAHKYTRGVVGIRAGSAQYPGAARLAVAGADTGLVGMVRFVGDDEVGAAVRRDRPEVVGDGRVQAWVVGPGAGDDAQGQLDAVWEEPVPLLVDADGLGVLGDRPREAPLVLTPHAGELSAMTGVAREEIEAAPLEHARDAATRFGAVVLLKGRHTVIASPDARPSRVTLAGTPWLATAGAGDVLAGLIGSLLAAGLDPFDAASVGSWLHGHAAERSLPGTAGDLPAAIGDVLRAWNNRRP